MATLPYMAEQASKRIKVEPYLSYDDICLKYVPITGKSDFFQEIIMTNQQILDMLPTQTKTILEVSSSKRILMDSLFFGSQIVFQGLFHKIPFINTILPNKYLKLLVRLSVLGASYFHIEEAKKNQYNTDLDEVYGSIAHNYLIYKLTGDFLKLNPRINIINNPFEPDSIKPQKNSQHI